MGEENLESHPAEAILRLFLISGPIRAEKLSPNTFIRDLEPGGCRFITQQFPSVNSQARIVDLSEDIFRVRIKRDNPWYYAFDAATASEKALKAWEGQ